MNVQYFNSMNSSYSREKVFLLKYESYKIQFLNSRMNKIPNNHELQNFPNSLLIKYFECNNFLMKDY
jgi:hypothetical protein